MEMKTFSLETGLLLLLFCESDNSNVPFSATVRIGIC